MSKAKFAAAKELIDEKKYDEARGILKTIDHPTAREWEAKLDKIAPSVSYKPPEPDWMQVPPPPLTSAIATDAEAKRKKKNTQAAQGCLMILVLAVIIYFLRDNSSAPPKVEPTTDSTQVAINNVTRSAEAAQRNLTATIMALTPSTATPVPPPTDPPPTDVLGTKSNPYPLQTAGAVRDGRFRVNRLLRNQTAAVKAANMFNENPPVGGEYVLANVTFNCDLPSDKTCTVSLMDLEIVGKAGKVYNKPFATVLETPFTGDVFGGGEITGDVAFIVNSTDGNFAVIVNDLGSRVFFAAGA